MKRVAVTGLGVISPVGNDVPAFWNALCSGTCGIGPITKFDATDYPVKLAAEVRDFDPRQSESASTSAAASAASPRL